MKYQRKSDDILQSEVESGLALLDPSSNTYFMLNRTGACVWDELTDLKSLDELCEAVSMEFNVSASACRADVEGMINAMATKGLIVLSDEAPG